MNDKVSNVMAVLTVMRNKFRKTPNSRYFTELRREAVGNVAETELSAKKYKDQDSARKTIHDACARRLKPDIGNIRNFDGFTEQWLRQNSMKLKKILLRHSKSLSQRDEVTSFFEVN